MEHIYAFSSSCIFSPIHSTVDGCFNELDWETEKISKSWIHLSDNKSKYDKTKWYALDDEKGWLDVYNPFDDTELWEDCYR